MSAWYGKAVGKIRLVPKMPCSESDAIPDMVADGRGASSGKPASRSGVGRTLPGAMSPHQSSLIKLRPHLRLSSGHKLWTA